MALPGLLVEYLITGALTMAWLLPLPSDYNQTSFGQLAVLHGSAQTLFLVPAAYAIGMLVDVLAGRLLRYPKQCVRGWAKKNRGIASSTYVPGEGTQRKARLTIHSSAAARESERRSSRDRIARGLVVNTVPLLVLTLEIPWWGGLAGLVAASCSWALCEESSYKFELDADACLSQQAANPDHVHNVNQAHAD